MHDAIFVRYPELYSGIYRRIFTRKVQYACDIADTIIAISEQTKRDLIDFFHADENKIQVVYQGCSNIFRQKVNKEQLLYVKLKYNLPDTYILNVGALEPRKNLKNLVLALASLLPSIDIPIVAVGGRTDYTAEVESLAKTVGVHLQCVSGADFVDFPAIYKGATLFCYPSIFEGFGIPILEAMCVGVPVLTSTGSCFAETGGDAALYADPADTNDIAQRLTDIIGNRNMQKKMVEKGFKQAQKFADDQVAHNLCRVVLSR
jgi:glycosyltransferase involved in cell wall biosynthesis